VLVELYLPVLEKVLEQQRANLREQERQNRALDERDRLRLQSEQVSADTSLAKLQSDGELGQPARHRRQQAALA
jgi:HlyD family secretion protein